MNSGPVWVAMHVLSLAEIATRAGLAMGRAKMCHSRSQWDTGPSQADLRSGLHLAWDHL